MDAKVMELRIREWMPIFEEQAKSGLGKNAWCEQNGIRKWEFYERQRECRKYLLKKANDPTGSSESAALAPSFVEIPSDADAVVSTSQMNGFEEPAGQIDITYGKFRISITGKVNDGVLARVIREISHA